MASKAKYGVVVGLPARNEEAGIFESLKSISEAVIYAQIRKYIIVVCVNGCTDNTAGQVKRFIKANENIRISLISSHPGLVAAQRKIVESYRAEAYVFPDADGKIAINSIKLLLKALSDDPGLMVAYAKTVSLGTHSYKNKNLANKIGLLYDSQKMLTPRKYFHGRLFAIKDWYMPTNVEIKTRANLNKHNRELLKYCSNGIFMSADDIFMSSYIMDRYGLEAIRQVNDAHCYSWPIGSFHDWLNVYRRRNIEMEKMKHWFPEYNYLWPHLNRKTDWRGWWQSDLQEKFLWIIYLSMKLLLGFYLRLELFLLKFKLYKPSHQWRTTTSTKKRAKRLFLFDIDGTLIAKGINGLNKFKEEIDEYKKLGDVFGLNTNRPWPEAEEIYNRLELNGPIICEDGSYYKLTKRSKAVIAPLVDRRLKNKIIKLIKNRYSQEAELVISNDKSILTAKNFGRIIFMTANRDFSVSLYVSKAGKPDNKFLKLLHGELKKNSGRIKINLSLRNNKITINNSRTSKIGTMLIVVKRHFFDYKPYLISDNEDIEKKWPNINFCGIMEAGAAYKKHCLYVANRRGESGLIQIINHCL